MMHSASVFTLCSLRMSKGESIYEGLNRELTAVGCFNICYSEFRFRIKYSLKLTKFIFICAFGVTF